MSKIEGNESPPRISSEAIKVPETLESSEDKLFYLKGMLEQKAAYLGQLNQHDYDEHKSITRERADLSIVNNRINMVQKQNLKFRNEAKKVYDSDFEECKDKFQDFGKKINIHTNQYEQQIDDLIRLLDQLTEKRNKKLELLETQKKRFLDESLHLEKQISDIEIQEKFLINDDADSEIEMLENELIELQSKLTILDDDHYNLENEEKDCESVENELTQKYPESELIELEKRFSKVVNKRGTTIDNLETEKLTESELSKSKLTLEEYEAKLDEEIQETSKFWNDIEKSSYEGLTNIERDIGLIKADISERAEKYKQAKSSDEERIESCSILIMENEAQAVKNELIELKKIKKTEEDKQASNKATKKQVDAAFEKAETSMKLVETHRNELKDSWSTGPPLIYGKAYNQKFAEPHTKNIFEKKLVHNQSAAAAKRIWDSDSSMEAELVKLDDLLKQKYRKGPDADNKK